MPIGKGYSAKKEKPKKPVGAHNLLKNTNKDFASKVSDAFDPKRKKKKKKKR